MPELPEVEVVRRGLAQRLVGATFQSVTVRQAKLRWPVPDTLNDHLRGQVILKIDRRSKYLLIQVASGHLIIHLGMTGSLVWAGKAEFSNTRRLPQHDHVLFQMAEGLLTYNDPRRFGAILWHPGPDLSDFHLFERLGPEPFSDEFTAQNFYLALRGRKLSIKQLLLGGSAVVGVGNIYCSEALFRAGIRPTRAAGRMTKRHAESLFGHIKDTLSEAILKGGSTLRDFVNSEGQSGYFQLEYFAYGRSGQPCKRCPGTIRQITQQQRSSFYCPSCQG
jgi:formamidopyrimidine-DNA glycosylase